MKFWIGVTDNKWFEFLSARSPDEVNFWGPSGFGSFQAVQPGSLFLFKLHSPDNFIAGGGIFIKHSTLPLSLAWDAFGEKNGANSQEALRLLIEKFRPKKPADHDPIIGCTILSNPFFFRKEEWIPAPADWARNIVKGKTYETDQEIGRDIWLKVQEKLKTQYQQQQIPLIAEREERYGSTFLTRARLGQGAFRVLVTDAYTRRCAITGERTLPALEAAHIQPFAKSGPNITANGLLLRSDLHKLFDSGYLSVTPDFSVEVSKKIKEEFENGRDYYALHGRKLIVMPTTERDRPSSEFLEWHNSNIYLG